MERKWICRGCGKEFEPKRNYSPGRGGFVVFCGVRCNARFNYHRRNARRRKGRPFINILGNTYGALNVIAHAGTNERKQRLWRVRCSLCNKEKVMTGIVLRANRCRSCGCVRTEKARKRFAALHLLERELGTQAMAGFERLAQMRSALDNQKSNE